MMLRHRFGAAVLSLLLGLSGCGGGGDGGGDGGAGGGGAGGGGGTPPPTPVTSNLTATLVNINTAIPRAGYELETVITLESAEPEQDFLIGLALAETGPGTNGDLFPIGVLAVPSIAAESRSFTLSTFVPANIPEGEYSLQAYVDIEDSIEETNEDDNLVSLPLNLDPVYEPGGGKSAWLLLESATATQDSFVLDTRSYDVEAAEIAAAPAVDGITAPVGPAGDASATMTVAAIGTAEPIDIEVFATLRFTRTDRANAQLDVPLYLWNSEEQRYMNAYGVDPDFGGGAGTVEWLPLGQIEPNRIEGENYNSIDRLAAHLEFYFPGQLAKELEDALLQNDIPLGFPNAPDLTPAAIQELRTYLTGVTSMEVNGTPDVLFSDVCLEIRPADPAFEPIPASILEKCLPITLVLPPQPLPPPDDEASPYVPVLDTPANPLIISKRFGNKVGGSEFAADAGIGVSLSADYRGSIAQVSGGIGTTILATRYSLVEATARVQSIPDYLGAPAGQQPGFTLNMSVLDVPLVSLNEPVVDIDGCFPECGFSKSYDKSKTFLVSGVPVTVKAIADGYTGVNYALTANPDRLGVNLRPFGTMFIEGTGGLGFDGFQVGVGLELLILAIEFPFIASIDTEVIDDGSATGTAEFLLTPSFALLSAYKTGGGAFFALREYFDVFCFCTRRPKTIIERWVGYEKTDSLLDIQPGQIDVVVTDGVPRYYK